MWLALKGCGSGGRRGHHVEAFVEEGGPMVLAALSLSQEASDRIQLVLLLPLMAVVAADA